MATKSIARPSRERTQPRCSIVSIDPSRAPTARILAPGVNGLLTGELGYVFYVSIVDAAILSVVALFVFRRSVRRLMRSQGSGERVAADAPSPLRREPTPSASPKSLSFAVFEPRDIDRREPPVAAELNRPARRRLVVAYTLGALAYSVVMTALQFGMQQPPLPLAAWIARGWANAWPLVPSLIALLVLDRPAMLRLCGWYVAVGLLVEFAVTLGGQLLRGTLNAAPITNLYWMAAGLALAAYAPLALIVVSAWRRIRAVMPLALAATIAFGFALLGFGLAMVPMFDVEAIRSALMAASVVTSVEAVYYGLFLIASLPVGWLVWRALRWLASAYERKRFSDVQLVVDCWWAIVAAEHALLLSIELGHAAMVGSLAAFAAYRCAVALSLRWATARESAPTRLLLLRVFGYQSRTESLFDRIAQAWRFHGPVHLIAGADLASRTATPGAILRLLSGSLGAQYVATADDVTTRIAKLDSTRDPDGRFRVNDVYCRDDAWRAALVSLLDASDRVLMDVRGFSARNQGCLFELEQLLLRLPTQSIVLLIDATTDLRLLGSALAASWARASQSGRASGDGTLALVKVERNRARELACLAQRLHGVGEPQRVVAAGQLAQAA
jgi:hypothetical protein